MACWKNRSNSAPGAYRGFLLRVRTNRIRAVVLSGLSAKLLIEAAAACSRADDTYATVRFENGDSGHYQVFEDRVEQMFMISDEQYVHSDMPKPGGSLTSRSGQGPNKRFSASRMP